MKELDAPIDADGWTVHRLSPASPAVLLRAQAGFAQAPLAVTTSTWICMIPSGNVACPLVRSTVKTSWKVDPSGLTFRPKLSEPIRPISARPEKPV